MQRSVLLADQEPHILKPLQVMMTREGLDVRLAQDGEAVLQEIEREPPDVIVLDCALPKRNAFDLCRAIRTDPRWSKLGIILVSNRARPIDKEKGLAFGADDYLTKPFSSLQLLRRVGDLCIGRARREGANA